MDLRRTMLALTLALLLVIININTTHSQAYHFSNGWFPGRKRSLDAYISAPKRTESPPETSIRECQIRPQIQQLLTDLIQTELERMARECYIVTDMKRSPDTTASLRSEDFAAWLQSLRHRDDRDVMKNI
ncbi:hypothetical protein LSH36_127g08022 [Paralvinella palmiformis]|uniref:Uncharacterized protein n=1 Tax=Paralvinella palmiformis TaxID=53620 RepID=A0AAD9JWW8_9ANNE|nr:hypothetical protein LSH36_127g08022 [Paralvinella palmiformis]